LCDCWLKGIVDGNCVLLLLIVIDVDCFLLLLLMTVVDIVVVRPLLLLVFGDIVIIDPIDYCWYWWKIVGGGIIEGRCYWRYCYWYCWWWWLCVIGVGIVDGVIVVNCVSGTLTVIIIVVDCWLIDRIGQLWLLLVMTLILMIDYYYWPYYWYCYYCYYYYC